MTITAHKAMSGKIESSPERCGLIFNFLVIMLLCIGLSLAAPSRARATNLGDNLPVSIIDGTSPPQLQGEDQQNPTVIALPDKNKWLVVWEDWRNWTSTGADIYGRFIGSDGSSYCGNEFIICGQPGDQTVPTLAYRPGSTVLVAWQDIRGTAGSGFVYYKTIDVSLLDATGSGFALGVETALSYVSIGGDSLTSRQRPDAAYDAARDQFWLVWIESRNALQRIKEHAFGVSGANATIFWQFGDTNYIGYATIAPENPTANNTEIIRNLTSSTNTIRRISHSSTTTVDTYEYEYFTNINNVTVACDELTAETLIVWEGSRRKATLTCTFEEGMTEPVEGNPDAIPPVEAKPAEIRNEGPSNDDTFHSELELGAWEDDTEGEVHIYSLFDKYIQQTVVHSQRLDISGIAGHYPSAAFEPIHRKFLVAWEAQQDNGFSKVYGQLLFSGGGLYGSNHLLSFQDLDGNGEQDPDIQESNQTRPQIAVDTTRQLFFVTWQDGRNSLSSIEKNIDIYGQHVDCEGTLWGNNYPITVAQNNQYNPQTSYNRGSHTFFTVWKDNCDFEASNSDIYGHCFNNGMAEKEYIYREAESFTADSTYKLWVNAGKSSPGRLYVLLIHDPVSAGVVYALTPAGQLTPFPYSSSAGWQTLFFALDGRPQRIDLHTLDFRQLGCTLCQGKAETDNFNFGGINIQPPSDKPYVNANDFKYLAGDLYVATYIKDGSAEAIPFDFNRGLIELHKLTIHDFNGRWRVASQYDGKYSIHPNLLVVSEPGDGNISATWSPRYENLAINYAPDESAYLLTFNIGSYNYVYKITSLSADKFSGTYTCTAYNQVIAKDQPVCGGRSDAPLQNWICQDGSSGGNTGVIAKFTGNSNMQTRTFTTNGPFKVQWNATGNGLFIIELKAFDDPLLNDQLVSDDAPARSSAYRPNAGEYYLDITATGNWEIDIVSAE